MSFYVTKGSKDVPVNEKMNLSLAEATEYSGLPRSVINKLVDSEKGKDLLLYPTKKGKKTLIVRKELERIMIEEKEFLQTLV